MPGQNENPGKTGLSADPHFPSLCHWCRGCWQPIAVWAALQALLAGATLAVKSDGKDRVNGHAGR
jgi:hypothetical protein